MKIVVDTNIVFSAILNSQSWIGQILLYSHKSVKFYSPRYLQTEIQNHKQKGFKRFITINEIKEKLKK